VAGLPLPGHNSKNKHLIRVHWRDWVSTIDEMCQIILNRCRNVFIGGESTEGLLTLNLASNHPEVLGVLTFAPAIRLRLKPSKYLFLNVLAHLYPILTKRINILTINGRVIPFTLIKALNS